MRGLEDSNASTIADFCILSRDAALRGVRLPGVLRDIDSAKSNSRRADKDLALDDIALIIFASKSVFAVILLEVEVLEDSRPGFKACAGSEACGASVDTTSGFTAKSGASALTFVWTDSR